MSMQMKAFIAALNQICEEKKLPKEVVIDTVKSALAAAYRRDYGDKEQEVRAEIDPDSGEVTVWVKKEVAKDVEDPDIQISLEDAKKIDKKAKVGEFVEVEDHPSEFGRIAAQTAKQVIIQRIREAERDVIYNEFKDKEGDIITGVVQRIEGGNIFVDLGRTIGIMFPTEQIAGERYYVGQRVKTYIKEVDQAAKGPQVILSRSHPGMIKKLFELEVPEIAAGTVEVKAIAREAGARTKIAVASNQEGVDPVGSCVGQRGTRVQAVMSELGEEKVDIILWNEDPKVYIANALSPAKVIDIEVDQKEKRAKVRVPEDQLSLAIGKQGQNVRLAAKLVGWNVDIIGADTSGIEATSQVIERRMDRRDIEEDIIRTIEQRAQQGAAGEAPSEEPGEAAPEGSAAPEDKKTAPSKAKTERKSAAKKTKGTSEDQPESKEPAVAEPEGQE